LLEMLTESVAPRGSVAHFMDHQLLVDGGFFGGPPEGAHVVPADRVRFIGQWLPRIPAWKRYRSEDWILGKNGGTQRPACLEARQLDHRINPDLYDCHCAPVLLPIRSDPRSFVKIAKRKVIM